MRLQAEGLPDAMDRRRRMANRIGHAAQAPMRPPGRACLQRPADRVGDLVIADLAWGPRARFVIKAVKPIPRKALTPLADRAAEDPQSLGDQSVVHALGY